MDYWKCLWNKQSFGKKYRNSFLLYLGKRVYIMIIMNEIDGVSYRLLEERDFSWLHAYGTVFQCIDQTGSGCICFGITNGNEKYFMKIAGAKTVHAEVDETTARQLLKDAVKKYRKIHCESLIRVVDAFEQEDLYCVVFAYAEGECLFDHWMFEKYRMCPEIETPRQKWLKLSVEKRLAAVRKLFDFFRAVRDAGYVAVDFYDSSIIYDFDHDVVTFCDIDLFEKGPVINRTGEAYFGTKRLKAPEENELGSVIDEVTNLFTLGAIIFDLFSDVKNQDVRYEIGHFVANEREDFELSDRCYEVLRKATDLNRENRYQSLEEFEVDFFDRL